MLPPPPQRGPFPHAAASWGRWMGPPWPGPKNRGLVSQEASHPWLERAIKRSGARHGIQAIFPSHGRWVVCWRFFFFFKKEKKKERGKRLSVALSPIPAVCRRHSQETPAASGGGFLLRLHQQPALRLHWPVELGPGHSPPLPCSAKWMDGLQTLKIGPSSCPSYQPGVITSRRGVPLEFLNSLVKSREVGQSGPLPRHPHPCVQL